MKSTKYFIALILLLFSINLISAEIGWETFGKFPYSWNAQDTSLGSRFNLGIGYNITIPNGIKLGNGSLMDSINDSLALQPIVTNFNLPTGSSMYMFIPNNNYLQVYDKNLNLVQEIYTGVAIANPDSMDFISQNGIADDIVGLFKINSTLVSFKVFSFNYTALTFNKSYEQNFTVNIVNQNTFSTGVKHRGNNAYVIVNNTELVKINNSASTITNIPFAFYKEFIIEDIDNSGQFSLVAQAHDKIIITKADGSSSTVIISKAGGSASSYIKSMRVFRPDATSLWKIAYFETTGGTGNTGNVVVVKPDGSSYWSKAVTSGSTGTIQNGELAVMNDYNSDGFNDLILFTEDEKFTSSWSDFLSYYVYRGYDGLNLNTRNFGDIGWDNSGNSWTSSLTLARLGTGSKESVLFVSQDGIIINDIGTNRTIFQQNATTYVSPTGTIESCITADIDLDGNYEIICSGYDRTVLFQDNYTIINAVLNSVTFDPSTTVGLNSALFMTLSASDIQGYPIRYIHNCDTGEVFTSENSTAVRFCTYSSVGYKNVTFGVRNQYFSGYNYYSYQVLVTQSGSSCNNNNICESGLGETNSNCPNDCTTTQDNSTTSQANGGLNVPTQIVGEKGTNGIEQGILPEIYYGTIGIFSYILVPVIVIGSIIMLGLILFAFGTIIKKFASR